MSSVLPAPPGLDIQNVIYGYTIHKPTEEQVNVSVQNKNALGEGYIFKETDRWMPGSLDGTQINRAVPVIPNIPKEAWGDGSINVEGNGYVSNASVIYTYKVDPCYDPQFDPNCPGYKAKIPEIPSVDLGTLYDAVNSGDSEQLQFNPDDKLYEDEEIKSEEELAKEEAEQKKNSKERLEKALAAADNTVMFANALAQSQLLDSLPRVNLTAYYAAAIAGGVYKESISLMDTKIPDNRKGAKNGLAQQLLHTKMVDMQYNKTK